MSPKNNLNKLLDNKISNSEIKCFECGWQGKKTDLLSLSDDNKEGICCPDCGNKDIKDLKK